MLRLEIAQGDDISSSVITDKNSVITDKNKVISPTPIGQTLPFDGTTR
jgi:hypothetical protein